MSEEDKKKLSNYQEELAQLQKDLGDIQKKNGGDYQSTRDESRTGWMGWTADVQEITGRLAAVEEIISALIANAPAATAKGDERPVATVVLEKAGKQSQERLVPVGLPLADALKAFNITLGDSDEIRVRGGAPGEAWQRASNEMAIPETGLYIQVSQRVRGG